MKKITNILAIIAVTLFTCSCADYDDQSCCSNDTADYIYYRNLLSRLDWGNGTTYVVGHLTPDMPYALPSPMHISCELSDITAKHVLPGNVTVRQHSQLIPSASLYHQCSIPLMANNSYSWIITNTLKPLMALRMRRYCR